eukprot:UC4_evm2s632
MSKIKKARDYTGFLDDMIKESRSKRTRDKASENPTVISSTMGFSEFGRVKENPSPSSSVFLKSEQDGMAPHTKIKEDDEAENDDSDIEEDDDDVIKSIPRSHETQLIHGTRAISAIDIDASGSRCVTGGLDSEVRFWHFAAMNKTMKSFRMIEPTEGQAIRQCRYSRSGDKILVIMGNSQPKVIDRDGVELIEFLKGDPYIFDLTKTGGHVSMCNDGDWHPTNRAQLATCSDDSTVRVWDVEAEHGHRQSLLAVRCRSSTGKKVPVTASSFSNDGRVLAAGSMDGTLRIWSLSSKLRRETESQKKAHMAESRITSISFSRNDQQLLTRSTDCTMKFWDRRKFNKPLAIFDGLPNEYDMTDCSFSPDERLILTGTSTGRKDGVGSLVFYDKHTLAKIWDISLPGVSVIRSLWHSRLNQIFLGLSN